MIEQRFLPNGAVIGPAVTADVPRIVKVTVDAQYRTYAANDIWVRDKPAFLARTQSKEFREKLTARNNARITNPDAAVFVARSRKGILGVGSVEINTDGSHLLSSLYVAEEGNGLGTALLDEGHGWQQAHGAHSSQVKVACNTPAVCFYKKAGYTFDYLIKDSIH